MVIGTSTVQKMQYDRPMVNSNDLEMCFFSLLFSLKFKTVKKYILKANIRKSKRRRKDERTFSLKIFQYCVRT